MVKPVIYPDLRGRIDTIFKGVASRDPTKEV
jgi:hypothetical protein